MKGNVVLDDESVDATLTEDSAEDTGGEVDYQKRYTDTQSAYTKSQQALKDEQSVWEDEQALLARVQEKFPHLMAEEEEDTETEDDFEEDSGQVPAAVQKELDELRSWRQSIDGERGEAMFQQHLAEELGDRDVPSQVHTWIRDRTMGLGGNRKALKQAVEEFDAIAEGLGSQKKSKPKAPHVPAGGKAGTGEKDFSQMSRAEVDQWMEDRVRALET